MLVRDFLDYDVAHFPGKLAVIFKQERLIYRSLQDRVMQLAAGLASRGVKKGDRVAVLMWNCNELVETYLAAAEIGAIFTPINYRLTRAELAYVIADSSPAVLIADHRCQEMITDDMMAGLVGRLYSASNSPPAAMRPYRELFITPHPQSRTPIEPNDACELLYTSGTTGKPKGVLLSNENVVWNTVNMMLERHDRCDDVALIVGPMFHGAALNSHYTSRLALGATAVIMDRFDAKETMELIQKEKVTVVSGSPTMFIMLMEGCKPGEYDTSSVMAVTSGADKLPVQVQQSIRKYFPNIEGVYDVYGATECSPCVTTLAARDSIRKAGSIGRPLPFVKVRLLDDEGKEVKQGEVGEIVVQGSGVMLGYYNQPEETSKVMKDGWFYTGDMAWADEEGFLYFTDRKKDIIVSGGENIASREVEEALYKHPDTVRVAVFGVPDEKWGERVVAAVILSEGAVPDAEAIRSFLRQHLSSYKIPREIIFVDKLPESGPGKVQKNALKKMYLAMKEGH